MSRGHARPVIDIVSPTVVAAKTTFIEAAVKKPIEPKADVVTVAKFSETVDDGSVGMFLVLVLLEALLIAVEASV